MKKIKIKNIDCYVGYDDRFKNMSMSLIFLQPFNNKYLAEKSILSRTLVSATKSFNSETKFQYYLEEAYDMYVDSYSLVIGKMLLTKFNVSFINPKYIEDDNIIEKAINVLNEVVFNPLFDEQLINKEKTLTIKGLNSRKNNKTNYAIEEFFKVMFKGEIQAINLNGTIEEVDACNIDTIIEAYNDIISSKCVLYVTGKFNDNDLNMLNNLKLENTSRYEYKTDYMFIDPYYKIVKEIKEFIENENKSQSVLCIGYRSNDYLNSIKRNDFAILAEMLGGYFHSTLVKVIREELGLCYNISTDYSTNKGYLTIYALISSDNYHVVKNKILNIIDDYKNGFVSISTLELTKTVKINEASRKFDSINSHYARFIASICNRKYYEYDEYVEVINNIKLSNIVQSAQSLVLDTIYFLKGVNHE